MLMCLVMYLSCLQVDEWWEQPAATVVDWVTVDEHNVITWLNRIKQIQMALYDQQLLSTS